MCGAICQRLTMRVCAKALAERCAGRSSAGPQRRFCPGEQDRFCASAFAGSRLQDRLQDRLEGHVWKITLGRHSEFVNLFADRDRFEGWELDDGGEAEVR